MDISFTPEQARFRDEVRDFLETALPADIRAKMENGQRVSKNDLVRWQHILGDKGWAAPHWAVEWGGTGWSPMQLYIFREELSRVPAPEPRPQNITLLGPVMIAYGTEAQKKKFLDKMRRCDLWFCQGFSEPQAGSDLAAVATSAVRDGNEYVINGQKIWTSGAHNSDWMFALVRTDPNARKQAGISYILIDMNTPGISVTPIVTIDGAHHTNQVHLENVRVPVENLIGEENKGWECARFLLGGQRVGIARTGISKHRLRLAKVFSKKVMYDGKPLSENQRFRERLAELEVEVAALELTNMRLVSELELNKGAADDFKPSILKIRGSEVLQRTAEFLADIAGPLGFAMQGDYFDGLVDEPLGEPWTATVMPAHFYERSATVFGGTTEIQKNIIARGLLAR